MENLSLLDILMWKQGTDDHCFSTLEERIKETPWGYTCKNYILVQKHTLEIGEYFLTPT